MSKWQLKQAVWTKAVALKQPEGVKFVQEMEKTCFLDKICGAETAGRKKVVHVAIIRGHLDKRCCYAVKHLR